MTNYALSAEMQKLKDAGMSQSQISQETGYDKSYVNKLLGPNYDFEQWESEMKRHTEFFKGLSPREEYAKHAEFRKTIDEF